jgi:hypothetical protein
MNTEAQITTLALENLQKNAGIIGNWRPVARKELDGKVEFKWNNKTIKFNAEIKRELRGYNLPQIIDYAERFKPLIVIAQYILPKIKDELRQNGIAYLETNGNIFLKLDNNFIWLEVQKTIPLQIEKTNRAFTKTGLKILFYYLVNEDLLNRPYREMAKLTGVALGNINYVLTGLKEENFLLKINKQQYKLQNKKELLNKWITAYDKKLKPGLELGTFRFVKTDEFLRWQELPLNHDKTAWGGEPAGDLLTHYLKPAELTLYTTETRNELIKNYRLLPDPMGAVKAYQKFWQDEYLAATEKKQNRKVVPPLLVYADLVNTGDRRCLETAEKVYEQYLQDEF